MLIQRIPDFVELVFSQRYEHLLNPWACLYVILVVAMHVGTAIRKTPNPCQPNYRFSSLIFIVLWENITGTRTGIHVYVISFPFFQILKLGFVEMDPFVYNFSLLDCRDFDANHSLNERVLGFELV